MLSMVLDEWVLEDPVMLVRGHLFAILWLNKTSPHWHCNTV